MTLPGAISELEQNTLHPALGNLVCYVMVSFVSSIHDALFSARKWQHSLHGDYARDTHILQYLYQAGGA